MKRRFYISDPNGNKVTDIHESGAGAITGIARPNTKGLLPNKQAYRKTWERLKIKGYVLHELPPRP